MARLNPGDVREILQMLEDGINLIPKLGKMEKMKMRSKIRRQSNWLSGLSSPSADMILHKLEERLSDVFSSYPYGFSDNLKKILEGKSARFRSK
jgi:hypothetical protein